MEPQQKELHRVVSTAIIRRDGKYLILKRNPNKKVFPNRWTVPGGGLTVDDYINIPKSTPDTWYFTLVNSLRREVKEETGLEVAKLNYLLDFTFVRPDGIPVIAFSYYGDWQAGDVQLNEESIDFQWVTAEEAKNYDLIEGILEEIEMADKIIKGANNH